ncbi:MAG: PilZ domain-containing protein [Acidobacteriia bacterium]|nr:PilZ domain-containing protein [Terriglobia bacterium]
MAVIYKVQRKYARYRCEVGVQVRTENAKNGYWGALADVSLGGCYVNTFSPLPPGTGVMLRLQANDAEIHLTGVIVTCHPGVGMGVEFKRFTTREDESRLKGMVGVLAKGA